MFYKQYIKFKKDDYSEVLKAVNIFNACTKVNSKLYLRKYLILKKS